MPSNVQHSPKVYMNTIINRFFQLVHKIKDLNLVLVLFIEVILLIFRLESVFL